MQAQTSRLELRPLREAGQMMVSRLYEVRRRQRIRGNQCTLPRVAEIPRERR